MTYSPEPQGKIDHDTFNLLCSEGRRDELWERVHLSHAGELFKSIANKFRDSLDQMAVEDIIGDRIAHIVANCLEKPVDSNLGGYLYKMTVRRYLTWLKREGRSVHPDWQNANDEDVGVDPFGSDLKGAAPRLDPATPEKEVEAAQLATCIQNNWMPFVRSLRADQLDLVTPLYQLCNGGSDLSEKERYGAYVAGFEPTVKRQTPRTDKAFKEGMSQIKKRFRERVLVPCGFA